jgi:putative phosphoesterase
MRIAVVSDIHGNLTAFEAVLADLRETRPDLVLHGGDLADAGSSPVQIIDHVRDLGWPGVVGNTDEMLFAPEIFEDFASSRPHLNSIWTAAREMAAFTREVVGEERLAWLRDLPRMQIRDSVALVHASPETPWRSPMPDASNGELDAVYTVLGKPVVVYGHIHLPYIRTLSTMVVANSGSVGMPHDGDRRASYLLIDDLKPQIRRVGYDLDRAIEMLHRSRLPHSNWIVRILESGRPQMP